MKLLDKIRSGAGRIPISRVKAGLSAFAEKTRRGLTGSTSALSLKLKNSLAAKKGAEKKGEAPKDSGEPLTKEAGQLGKVVKLARQGIEKLDRSKVKSQARQATENMRRTLADKIDWIKGRRRQKSSPWVKIAAGVGAICLMLLVGFFMVNSDDRSRLAPSSPAPAGEAAGPGANAGASTRDRLADIFDLPWPGHISAEQREILMGFLSRDSAQNPYCLYGGLVNTVSARQLQAVYLMAQTARDPVFLAQKMEQCGDARIDRRDFQDFISEMGALYENFQRAQMPRIINECRNK